MDTNHSQSIEQVYNARLRVMVDRERNKVLYAEAAKDFVDALFSFLTLPLGTIARLVAKDSNMQAVTAGSLSSLYQSVAGLDEQYLWTHTCKEMLLNPRNSMEAYCEKMKLNIDDTEPLQYYLCDANDWSCYSSRRESTGLVSTFRNKTCSCGRLMTKVFIPDRSNFEEYGFVKETASFIISDDLHVMPNVIGTSIRLLRNLGVHNIQAIRERTLHVSRKEVLDLLKLSILSNTPLTDFVFRTYSHTRHGLNLIPRNRIDFEIGDVSPYEFRQLSVKILVRRSTGVVLYAEAEEDFVDFLFSFLTFPLGAVLNMLEGSSSISCLDNLYSSMSELSPDRYLQSLDIKNMLVKPLCAPQFELNNQLLPIIAAPLPMFYCHTHRLKGFSLVVNDALTSTPQYRDDCAIQHNKPLRFIDPKFCMSKSSCSGEYAKGPSMFMVTDNLVVSPMSSVSALSYLTRSNVPLFDLDEMVIRIGVKEGLSILKASLISTSALTNGLSQFLSTNHRTMESI